MGWKTCCVVGCENNTKNKSISFYEFPKNRDAKRSWIEAIRNSGGRTFGSKSTCGKKWRPEPHDLVCGLHFHPTGKRHRNQLPHFPPAKVKQRKMHPPETGIGDPLENPGPSLLNKIFVKDIAELCDPTGAERSDENEGNIKRHILPNWHIPEETGKFLENPDYTFVNEIIISNSFNNNSTEMEVSFECKEFPSPEKCNESITNYEDALMDHNYATSIRANSTTAEMCHIIDEKEARIQQLQNQLVDMNNQVEELNKKNAALESELRKQNMQLKNATMACSEMESKLKSTRLSAKAMTEKKLQFYTGLASKSLFESFRDLMRPAYLLARSRICKNYIEEDDNHQLSYDQQLLVVLMKSKLGLLESDLGYRFHVSQSTISRIWKFWTDILTSQQSESQAIGQNGNLTEEITPAYLKELIKSICKEKIIEKSR